MCIDIGNTYIKGPSYKKKTMDLDISLVDIVTITTMTIITIAIINLVVTQNSMYHRILSCMDKLEREVELKLGQDGKEFGSDDVGRRTIKGKEK